MSLSKNRSMENNIAEQQTYILKPYLWMIAINVNTYHTERGILKIIRFYNKYTASWKKGKLSVISTLFN